MLVDGDQITETNCVRQPFAAADVGLNKAVVLINRVNLFWGLRWQAHPEHFHKDSLRNNSTGPHLIIGCVDTPLARLDRDHRSLLAERYFPHASHQVIILSTDSEIDAQFVPMLGDSITRMYELKFDSASQSTRVEEGYFSEGQQRAIH